jgi:hypothetical protein
MEEWALNKIGGWRKNAMAKNRCNDLCANDAAEPPNFFQIFSHIYVKKKKQNILIKI